MFFFLSSFFFFFLFIFFEINFCSPWFTINSRPIIPPRVTYTTHCGLCTWSTALAIDRTFTHTAECKFSAAGLVQIDLCIDLIKVPNSAIVALPGAFTTWWISNHWGYKHPTCAIPGETYANQSYIYSRLKIPLYIQGSIKTHRIYTRDFIYPARITVKLYDMIQVYSSGSTVIMHMHYI